MWRRMPKLKIIYIASVIMLGVLVGFTIFRPMATGEEYSEVQRAQLLEKEEQWIIQFDIINHEGEDMDYIIEVLVDEQQYAESVLIPNGRTFTYIHHIYPDEVTKGDVGFAVYKQGESVPIEQATFFLS